jgi:hypothetical protein
MKLQIMLQKLKIISFNLFHAELYIFPLWSLLLYLLIPFVFHRADAAAIPMRFEVKKLFYRKKQRNRSKTEK